MNFQSLKGMIDSLVQSYKCPECTSGITDANVDIIGAAGTTINIDIECSSCHKHSMIKTEILSINLSDKKISKESIESLKNSLLKSGNISLQTNTNIIKDNEIVDLNKDLRKTKLNVADLFSDDNK